MANEPLIRLGVFVCALGFLLVLERLLPWRRGPLGARRWFPNIGLAVLGSALVRLTVPAAAVGAAAWAEARGIGLLPRLGAPGWVSVLASVVLLDLLIYWQHRWTHTVPALWRLHRVHHADPELDATTGLRFHPVEILLSLGLKVLAVAALGAPAVAVLAFEVALNATAMFNYAAVRLPPRLERWLRLFVVTPEMHRTHHSEVPAEAHSCFGFCLPWWDRLFGSYRAAPAAGEAVVIGLARGAAAAAPPIAVAARAAGAVNGREAAAASRDRERNMQRRTWARALRQVPVLAALGVALGACGGDARPARYGYGGGSYGGGPGYYGSPYSSYGYGGYGRYDRHYGSRGYYGGGDRYYGRPSAPRTENWSQGRLQQHWIDQSRRPR